MMGWIYLGLFTIFIVGLGVILKQLLSSDSKCYCKNKNNDDVFAVMPGMAGHPSSIAAAAAATTELCEKGDQCCKNKH